MRGNLFAANCPSRQVLDRIGDRWSVLVVHVLAGGTLRHGEIAARIGGITPKMLTQTLRGLERDGLLTRTVHAEVPPRVDYELTTLGRSLLGVAQALEDWAETHISDVDAARAAYDARTQVAAGTVQRLAASRK
ncbi:helix-turn-helix transcriptional regulator [Actinomycetospora endophytica]|uniref:Helix-turn-helix transcriptional regulator n=1 Tax=Actinomycetospora endophytica TaxID=2291215 RepID=A0ABS8P3I2_9PSEU|nr:helix-turn-helix domain-containing protein [Actinomycetospora endophytica]MCD2192812.1 helix-turn-helix transcriptional regulator [Actinomycetospora endophytica]